MAVPDNVINDMLKNLPAPMRQAYGSIVNGDVVSLVHCDSEYCKGRVIGHIMADGRVVETDLKTPTKKELAGAEKAKISYGLYTSGLEGSRQRLDGNWGFRCYCGNNSIVSQQERGIISAGAPTKDQIMTIARNVQQKPTKVTQSGGKISVDGFTIEAVR